MHSLSPQLPDEFILIWKFEQIEQELASGLHLLTTHAMQDTKVVHCLQHCEVPIQGQLLEKQ